MKKIFSAWRTGILASLMVFVTASATASMPTETYDLVIRNGRVLDGAGNPWVHADVAISDGRFARIGRVEGTGTQEIDAQGLYVTPGWIDMMDQSGGVLLKNGRAENKVLMGVTTVISGEGGIPVPTAEARDYFSQMEAQKISVNFGTYYAAWQARIEVMGSVAGRPTTEQMEQMKARVATAMEAGAFGISTALIYPPSSFQSTDELIELAKVVSKYGGIYATHMRDESADLLKAVNEAIEIGEQGGVAVEIFHFKAAYQPGWGTLMEEAGAAIDAARNRKLDIAANIYPYPAGGTGLAITVPNRIFADGEEKGLERLQDPAIREQLKREVAAGSAPGWSNLVSASGGWGNIVVANANSTEYDAYRFKSIADIASERGEHPADVAWDMVLAAAPKQAMALFFMMSEEDIETALQFPWTSIGSDAAATEKLGEMDALGLPHPRSYGTFPRIIAEYVKKRRVLSLPEAVRKMTSWPASRMGLNDRGVIREGLKADVVIFNYEQIEDRATWEKPMALPAGIDYVLVNGIPVVANGKHTNATPGEVLRGPGHRPHE
jgi:N-acyl-D-amino-acid deacylase